MADDPPTRSKRQTEEQRERPVGRALLVDNLKVLLLDEREQQRFFTFIADHAITELGLYLFGPETKRVLPDLRPALAAFVARARGFGTSLTAIGGSEREFDEIMRFQNDATLPGKFDALWLEYEYWNNDPKDFHRYLHLLDYMRQAGNGLTVGAYIGWPLQSEVKALSAKADRLFIHCYVDSGHKTYDYCRERLTWFGSLGRAIEIWPLFSAEWRPAEICNSKTNPTGKEPSCFMGPWLASHGFDAAEQAFRDRFRDEPASWRQDLMLKGFYYFAYSHAKE